MYSYIYREKLFRRGIEQDSNVVIKIINMVLLCLKVVLLLPYSVSVYVCKPLKNGPSLEIFHTKFG